MDINKSTKILCKARGLSFAELANRLQITRQTLHRTTTAPRLSSIEKIAEALNVPAWIILHPDPAGALWKIEHPNQDPRPALSLDARRQDPGAIFQEPRPAALLLCPACHKPIILQAATLEARPEDKQPEEGQPETKQRQGSRD